MQEEFIEEQCGRSGDESLPSMVDYSGGLAKSPMAVSRLRDEQNNDDSHNFKNGRRHPVSMQR